MRNLCRCALSVIVFIAISGCMNGGAVARGRISHLQPIEVAPGPNQIGLFVADGRSGLITQGWRDLGGSVGYRVYSVMIPNTNPLRGWDIVPVQSAAGDPAGHEAIQIFGSARFARAWLDGAPTTLLITARRDPAAVNDPARPVRMIFDTYQLVTARKGNISENAFEPVMSSKSSHEFCNPDLAIAREFGMEVPATYTGRNQVDGCSGGV